MKKNILLCVILILGLLVGCSASKSDMTADSMAEGDFYYDEPASAPESMDDMIVEDSVTSKGEVAANRKIIEKVYMDVETKEFDVLIEKLKTIYHTRVSYPKEK